jgi:hypothetical protein
MDYRVYAVSRRDKAPLLQFILGALEDQGCRILRAPEPNHAPFRITFETPDGERLGILVYAFFANSRLTTNRPADEHRFQVKYGPDTKRWHELWQDPYLLYTTLFCGIDPERGIFVGADPVLHSPTRFFISIEYKEHHAQEILHRGWHSWERERRSGGDEPVEVLVGGTASSFLRYVRFEREALREDQGHRQWLAERVARPEGGLVLPGSSLGGAPVPTGVRLHALAQEFEMDESEVLDLIAKARRLKMAVRGWVAEEHLARQLVKVPGITKCERLDEEGQSDIRLSFKGRSLTVECKNVLRETNAAGQPRVDFQRTRASKSDPCSRYYSPDDFDVVAACLHAVTERWEYRFIPTRALDPHKRCTGKLSNSVKVDARWTEDIREALAGILRG